MKISDEAVEAARAAYSDACRDLFHTSAQGRFRAALEAAVPYLMPDREALEQALLRVWRGRTEAQIAASPAGHCAALADAVLALFGGSETCDHSDYITDDNALARCGSCGKLMSEVPSDQPS